RRLRRDKGDDWSFGFNDRSRDGADWADVRGRGIRGQIGTLMELRRKEQNREEQRNKGQFMRTTGHASNWFLRRRLRNKGYQGQEPRGDRFLSRNSLQPRCYLAAEKPRIWLSSGRSAVLPHISTSFPK